MYLLFILPVSLFPLEAFNFLGRVGLSFVPLEDEGRPNGFKAMTVTQKKHQSVNISDSGYVQSLASAVPVYSDALRKSFNRMIVNNRHRSNISQWIFQTNWRGVDTKPGTSIKGLHSPNLRLTQGLHSRRMHGIKQLENGSQSIRLYMSSLSKGDRYQGATPRQQINICVGIKTAIGSTA